mmetsp:Transcript_6361/g.25874  ORF Transcript_6361/g.25874 Transcript_6361/m.25874 type:complete len:397 (+) Transcript_6361:1035-2225(+)
MVEVELVPVLDRGNRHALEGFQVGVTLLVHEVGEARAQVLHDLEAVDHGRGADLHRAAAHRDELGRVAPGADAADAAERQAGGGRVAGDLGHHVQRDRLHRWPAVAAVRAPAVGDRAHRHAVQVHAHHGVDGVDQADRIRTAGLGRAGRESHVGDVGGELHDDGQLRVLLAPRGDPLDVLRHLAHGRAHAAFAHAVRAAEVQLHAVGAGVGHALKNRLPARLVHRHHQRDDHGPVGEIALHAADLVEVDLQRPVADQLDVVEADDAAVGAPERGIARAVDVDDRRVLAERLPDHAAPAGLEGAAHVDLLVGRRGRRQPEGVGALDAEEIGAEVSHGGPPGGPGHSGGQWPGPGPGRWPPQRACRARRLPRSGRGRRPGSRHRPRRAAGWWRRRRRS